MAFYNYLWYDTFVSFWPVKNQEELADDGKSRKLSCFIPQSAVQVTHSWPSLWQLHPPQTNSGLHSRLMLINYSEPEWLNRHLVPRKATRPDGTQTTVLSHLPWLAFKFIVQIFNKSMPLNYLPNKWKEVKVAVLPKLGKD
jgi:hypothetical protein